MREDSETYIERGVELGRQGKIVEAIETFRTAMHLDPHHGYVFSLLGQCYDHLGNSSEAIKAFRTALRLGHKTPAVYVNLAVAHQKLATSGRQQLRLTMMRRQ